MRISRYNASIISNLFRSSMMYHGIDQHLEGVPSRWDVPMLTIIDLAMLLLLRMTCGSLLRVQMILRLLWMMMLRGMRRMVTTPTLIMVWVHHRLRPLTTSSPFPSSGIMVIATFVFMMIVHSTMLDCGSLFVEGNPLIKPKGSTSFLPMFSG